MSDAVKTLVKFKTTLTKEVVARNMIDIEEDKKCQVRYVSMYWTLGRYDTVVIFDAPDEKVAMQVILKRADRMDIETLIAVPADAGSPMGSA
ncbi:MAG: GYD domain-containing protein [Methanoregula sp.]|nr:GYD domain-containing protein [Methanoregula sp.]